VLQSLIDHWPSGAAVAEDGDKSAQKAKLAQAMAVVSFTKTIDQAREKKGEGAGGEEGGAEKEKEGGLKTGVVAGNLH
jgi:hypothetical protein